MACRPYNTGRCLQLRLFNCPNFGVHFRACPSDSFGYVPYSTVCENTYLQNLTWTGTKNYESKHVMIGSDVTNKVAQGPVVVNSGSTRIKASHSATITKDFEVRQGAEFIITNE